jgi:hypothetical protein
MIPRRFIAYAERRLGRALSSDERQAVDAARSACMSGKRETVKAMRLALHQVSHFS